MITRTRLRPSLDTQVSSTGESSVQMLTDYEEELLEEEEEEEEIDEEVEDDFDDDDDDLGDDDDDLDDDGDNASVSSSDTRLEELSNTVRDLQTQNQQLMNKIEVLTSKGAEKSGARKDYTDQELRELYKKDPVAAMAYLTDRYSERKSQQVAMDMQKQQFDQQANDTYAEFLKNPEFQKALQSEWSDLLASGADPKGPKTYLKACQMAAKSLGVVSKKTKPTTAKRKSRDSISGGQPTVRNNSGAGGVTIDRLPKKYKNRYDLYAVRNGYDESKMKAFEKRMVQEYKAERRARR